jgi:hypothetical protein
MKLTDAAYKLSNIKPRNSQDVFIIDLLLGMVEDSIENKNEYSFHDILNTVTDQCHDGAYTEEETSQYFYEDQLEHFLKYADLLEERDGDIDENIGY